MEVLHQILNKFGDELLQPVLLDLFVGLLLPLANDESTTCREMAAKLIQLIIENADDDRLKAIRTMLRLWTQQMDKPALRKSSLHVYRVMLENRKTSTDDMGLCFESVTEIVGHNVVGEKSKVTWEVIEQALEVLIKLAAIDPGRVFSSKEEKLWSDILGQMACEDTTVRLAASKLVGLLFSRGESLSDGQLKVESLCLRVPSLTASARHSLEQIKDPNSTPELGTQAVKNLIFLGQHFYKTNCDLPQKKESAETNGDLEVISCLTWLVSRVAAEIRYERTVAEVLYLIICN
jgi:U3 small nucleolar RNA-associated protein 20